MDAKFYQIISQHLWVRLLFLFYSANKMVAVIDLMFKTLQFLKKKKIDNSREFLTSQEGDSYVSPPSFLASPSEY